MHCADLPVDILRSIFFFCPDAPPFYIPEGFATDPRVAITHVCSSWRAAALGTRQLWSNVVIDLESHPLDIVVIAEEVLSRAEGMPLKIAAKMRGFRNRAPVNPSADEFVNLIIVPNASSIRSLQLFAPLAYIKTLLTLPSHVQFPILDILSIRQASLGTITERAVSSNPSIFDKPRTLELDVHFPELAAPYRMTDFPLKLIPWTQLTTFVNLQFMPAELCLHVLSSLPVLVSCGMSVDAMDPDRAPEWPSRITLLHLERLHLRFVDHDDFDCFLHKNLELPSIRDLALKECSWYGLGWGTPLSQFLIHHCGTQLENVYVADIKRRFYHHFESSAADFERFIQTHRFTLRNLHIPLVPEDVTRELGLLRPLVSGRLCPRLERLSLDACSWDNGQHFKGMMDELQDAEKQGRAIPAEIHAYFYDRYPVNTSPADIESVVSARINDVSTCRVNVTIVKVQGLHFEIDIRESEMAWFGYYA